MDEERLMFLRLTASDDRMDAWLQEHKVELDALLHMPAPWDEPAVLMALAFLRTMAVRLEIERLKRETREATGR